MKYDFNTFYSLADRMARQNQFRVVITPPQALLQKYNIESLMYMVSNVLMPGRTVETQDFRPGGHFTRTHASHIQYQDFLMGFVVRATWAEKDFFDDWIDLMYNKNSATLSYYIDYIGTIDMHALDKNGNTVHHIKLHEAYPRDINAVDLGQGNNDSVVQLTINFVYHDWERVNDTSEGA